MIFLILMLAFLTTPLDNCCASAAGAGAVFAVVGGAAVFAAHVRGVPREIHSPTLFALHSPCFQFDASWWCGNTSKLASKQVIA